MAVLKSITLTSLALAIGATAQSANPGVGKNPKAQGATDNVTPSTGPNGYRSFATYFLESLLLTVKHLAPKTGSTPASPPPAGSLPSSPSTTSTPSAFKTSTTALVPPAPSTTATSKAAHPSTVSTRSFSPSSLCRSPPAMPTREVPHRA